MPKRKTSNIFHRITWEVNTVCNEVWPVFVLLQRIKQNLYWKIKFLKQATYIRYVMAKLNQHADLLGILFTEDSLKIEKGLKLVFRPHISKYFLIKIFVL